MIGFSCVTQNHQLAPAPPLELRARRTLFAEQFEASALSLDALTPHQQEKLDECAAADASSTSTVHLHVRAPAGSGKTFVALHRLLDALRRDDDALYVARNAALCLFAASWVAKRAASAAERRRLLARLHVLHAPVENGWKLTLKGPASGTLHLLAVDRTGRVSRGTWVVGE